MYIPWAACGTQGELSDKYLGITTPRYPPKTAKSATRTIAVTEAVPKTTPFTKPTVRTIARLENTTQKLTRIANKTTACCCPFSKNE